MIWGGIGIPKLTTRFDILGIGIMIIRQYGDGPRSLFCLRSYNLFMFGHWTCDGDP